MFDIIIVIGHWSNLLPAKRNPPYAPQLHYSMEEYGGQICSKDIFLAYRLLVTVSE